jgi:hypothetical protein
VRRIEFRVQSQLPPKKDGANSMWAKPVEVDRLIALRRAALEALAGQPPLRANISLELELHYPLLSPGRQTGDLDNFITGVCDGLMAANPRIARDARWDTPELAAISPFHTVAIVDDAAIVSITARKIDGSGPVWYRVALVGE